MRIDVGWESGGLCFQTDYMEKNIEFLLIIRV